MANDPPLTAIIHQAQQGDERAAEDLYAAVYDELRRVAHGVRSDEAAQTINTTALVHEAWIKLAASPASEVASRAHFKHIAARAMRQVLVDQARARTAVNLDRALHELEEMDPRAAKVVECRFFGGMDVEETAEALGISTPTVKRDWRVARAWLARALGDP